MICTQGPLHFCMSTAKTNCLFLESEVISEGSHSEDVKNYLYRYLCIIKIIILTTLNYCHIALTIYLIILFLHTDMLPQHQINLLAPELFFFNFSTPVYKM